jgi:peroxiredoxin
VELQSNMAELKKAGIQPVAISYDSVKVLDRFAKQGKIKFPILSDPGSKTIDAYKIRNVGALKRMAGVPHPGTFVIGKDGRIVAKLAHDSYRKRHTTEEIIKAAGK